MSSPCFVGYGVSTENSNETDVDAAPTKNTDNAIIDVSCGDMTCHKKASVGTSSDS